MTLSRAELEYIDAVMMESQDPDSVDNFFKKRKSVDPKKYESKLRCGIRRKYVKMQEEVNLIDSLYLYLF